MSERPPERSRLEQESMAREWCMWTSVNEDKGEERAEDDKNERTEKYTQGKWRVTAESQMAEISWLKRGWRTSAWS